MTDHSTNASTASSQTQDDDRGPVGLVPDRLSDVADTAFSVRQIALAIGDDGRGSGFAAVLQLNDRLSRLLGRRFGPAQVAT